MAKVLLPKLFKDLESQSSTRDRRAYVEDEIVRMIQDGSLSMTALLNQRPSARQISADVIYGHTISDGNDGYTQGQQRTDMHIRPEIKRATVVLEAMGLGEDGKPRTIVRWADGVKPAEGIVVGSSSQYSVASWERNWIEEASPATLPLRDAWMALSRHGENCMTAPLPQNKKDLWHCREVHGSVKDNTKGKEKRSRADEARA